MNISSATGASALLFSVLLSAACGPEKDKSPAEKLSDSVEEAGEEVGDEIDDATDDK